MNSEQDYQSTLFPPVSRRAMLGHADSATGYLVSSLELRAGLQMRAIPPGALPLEELGELLRMHASWAQPPAAQFNRGL